MRRSITFILAVAVLGISATLALRAADQKPSDQPPPLHVSQILGTRPIGLLGKPLGERLVVQGAMAQHVMLANPIAVEKVDGQPTTKPVNIEVSGFNLKEGIRYELEGYESGAFKGGPEWHAPGVQQPFQYRPSFVVTRAILPATKSAFQSFRMGGPMPAPVDVAKLERVTDGMTLGAIVDELGPGWMSQWEGVGIITWFLSDGRELRIWPAGYNADEVITKNGESGQSRMWIQKSTYIRLNPTTAPATTQSS